MEALGRRTLAVMIAIMMVIPVSVCLYDSSDMSSGESVDYEHYYYDQLTKDLSRRIYNDIVALTDADMTATIELTEEDIATLFPDESRRTQSEVGAYISEARDKAINAVSLDNPRAIYYIDNLGASVSISFTTTGAGIVKSAVIPLKYTKLPYYTSKSACDAEIKDAIDAIKPTIDTSSTYNTVKGIHNVVANTLEYYLAGDEKMTRSVYTSFVGWYEPKEHKVVCEGYAKMFKVLCDEFDIPCITVMGPAKDKAESTPDGHMWNYVYMEDKEKWYLVDCTWDDQSTVMDTYFLTGTSCDGFYIKVGESHTPTTTSSMFAIPTLSATNYLSDAKEYTVHFETKYGVQPSDVKVIENNLVPKPTDPQSYGHNFVYWYSTDPSVPWDFDYDYVTSNVTLNAKWTDEAVWNITYDTQGGSKITGTICVQGDSFFITSAKPTKDGASFKEWNTNKDGQGIAFQSGAEVTPSSDITFYAIWNCGDTSPGGIDTTMNQIGEFLSGEIIPGVNNTTLLIAIVTILVGVLAIMIIARK